MDNNSVMDLEVPDGKETVKAFIGGVLFTLMLVIVIPVVTSTWIQPFVEKQVDHLAIAIISTSLLVSVNMLLVTIGFSLLLGGGAILRRYGIIGVLGLIFAYWLLGNPYGAVIPVATLILVAILKWLWNRHKNKGKPKKEKKRRSKKK